MLGEEVSVPAAADVVQKVADLVDAVQVRLKKVAEDQARYANKRRRDVEFSVGDKVLLSTKNLRTLGGSKKFK